MSMRDAPTLVDASNQPVPLGETIGAGGEGTVYAIRGEEGLVAKVYHKAPLAEAHDRKLRKLVTLATTDVLAISAWPRALLFDARTQGVRGLIMPRIRDAHPLHELYGTTTRARRFPHAQWGHLVLAARNLAAAFGTLHERGVVIGDVNQGNLMVDANMCVRLIDCDSFQVKHRREVFRCPVGTPHFTPPELQSKRLVEVNRTINHDAFGLAILIFHLLFVGRHPFAGRFRGDGDMTIERAIAERRFAFSHRRDETLIDPPPASLTLDDLPAPVGQLFERAFRADGDSPERPQPEEWVYTLESLLKQRQQCQLEDAHIYSATPLTCPWCRIENAGGPTFFLNVAFADGSSESRLAAVNAQLERVEALTFPDVPDGSLRLPKLPMARKPAEPPVPTPADRLTLGWAASAGVCLLGGVLTPLAGPVIGGGLVAVGAIGSLATAGPLAFGKSGRGLRDALTRQDATLKEHLEHLHRGANRVRSAHTSRRDEYDAYASNISTGLARYRSDTEDMHTILRQIRIEQKDDFLRGFAIRDYRRRIPGLTPQMIAVLESYGVDSAYQVTKIMLSGVPNLGPSLTMELLAWRQKTEEKFEYKPEAGLTERELNADRQEATRRFKLALGHKILSGAKQLRAMAFAAEGKLGLELKQFAREVESWRELAHQRQDAQAARNKWERLFNRSLPVVIAAGIIAPLVGLALWALLGGL